MTGEREVMCEQVAEALDQIDWSEWNMQLSAHKAHMRMADAAVDVMIAKLAGVLENEGAGGRARASWMRERFGVDTSVNDQPEESVND
jgi:hypothetical protein